MKKAALEKNLVVFLFILVLVIFSFAERDSKKLDEMYAAEPVKKDAALVLTAPTKTINRN